MNSAAYPELSGNPLYHNDRSGQFSPFAFFTNFYFLMLSAFFSLFVSRIHRHIQYRSYLYALCLTIQRSVIFFHEHTNRFLFLALSFGLFFFPFVSCDFFWDFFSFSLFLLSNPYLSVFVLSYLILYFTKAPLFPNERQKGRGPGLQGKYRGPREVQGAETIKIH